MISPCINKIYNVGISPSSMTITSDGKYGYVTNSNNYEIPGNDSVTVLNLKTGLPKLTIKHESFNEPYRMAINDKTKLGYVCNSGGTTLTIIDIRSNTVKGTIVGFDGPGSIAIFKSIAYVTNYGSEYGVGSGNGKTISVVNLKTNTIISTINVNLAPSCLALSKNGDYLYVTCYVNGEKDAGTLDIINTKNGRIRKRIPGLFGPFSIALTTDENFAYISNFGSNNFAPFGNTVSVIDLLNYQIVKTIEVGIQPSGLVIGDNFAFVSNYNTLYASPGYKNLTAGEGTINIIDLNTNKVVFPTISVGQTPSTLTLSKDNKRLYVCKYMQNTVVEIKLPKFYR